MALIANEECPSKPAKSSLEKESYGMEKRMETVTVDCRIFLVAFYLPVGLPRFDNAVLEAFHLMKWYAQEHVLLCLVPAFFIAGAIGVFISQLQ